MNRIVRSPAAFANPAIVRFAAVAVAILVSGGMTGCGQSHPTTYEVAGVVVFADGKPLTHGSIEFESKVDNKLITARSPIDKDGRFSLGTYQPGDGALPGTHRVAVFAGPEIGTGFERPDKLPPAVLDPKFGSFDTSGLSFTVKPEANDFRIVVAAPVKP